jgi:hypothetical protein
MSRLGGLEGADDGGETAGGLARQRMIPKAGKKRELKAVVRDSLPHHSITDHLPVPVKAALGPAINRAANFINASE